MKWFRLWLCCFIVLSGKLSFAQRIDTTLAAYADKFQPERIHIQFDKPAYAAGETIWFKAYLMAGDLPSAISKNLYTDWYDANGNLLAHSLFPVVQSGAAGEFIIPDTLSSTAVHVKAYTNWMLNFDTSFLFEKNITLTQKTPPKSLVKITVVPSLRFFPEGGDAVEGLSSRIAFQANDQYGRPVKIKGVVTGSKGAVVDSIKTQHDGMGALRIVYEKGETYTAKWYDEHNAVHTTVLPTPLPGGATIEVGASEGKKTFIIRRTDDVAENMKQLHIVATMHQNLVYMANANLLQTSSIGGAIPTASLVSGVLQITLLTNDWKPIAERICYVDNNDAVLEPQIGFTGLGLGKRGLNTIELSMPDSVTGNLSLSVTDKGIGADSSNNIIAQLLLSGELKGAVYKPQYYFSNSSDSVAKHLDLVMLTHGWRRFNWEAIVAGQMPTIKYPAEKDYLTFSGKIYGANSTQLRSAGGLFAILQGKDSSRQVVTATIKPDGTFEDPNIVLFDSTKIYYQFSNKAFGDVSEVRFMNSIVPAQRRISLDKTKMVSLDTSGNARLRFLASEEARLAELLKGTTLAGVTVTTKVKSPLQKLDEKYASGLFQGSDAYQFDLTNDVFANSYQSIFTYLQGKVAGLQITSNGGNTSMSWRGGTPSVYLNEMPTDVSQLSSTSVSDIAYIKVFRPPFMGGFNGANGAIAVYTKKGGDQQVEKGKGMASKMVIGYTAVKQFYSPNYGTIDPRNEAQDVRSTLYWAPTILTTTENHRLKFTFYNNDVTDAFRLILEGISSDGRLVHIEKTVE